MRQRHNLRLEFAPQSPWSAASAMLVVVGLLASTYGLWQRQQLLAERARAYGDLQVLTQQSSAVPQVKQPGVRTERHDETERLIASLRRPWEPMLDGLQEALAKDVVLTSVQADGEALRLKLSGQAHSSGAFVEFIQRLKANPQWRAVDPLAQARQPDSVVPGARNITFSLSLQWYGS